MELRQCSIMVLVRLLEGHPTIVFMLVLQDEISFCRLAESEGDWWLV